jgi:Phosphoribosyl-ATP pyrophosphohydrolase.
MQTPDSLNQVAQFHNTFKHPILESPTIPPENRCNLRVALIAEELKELEVAILEKDIVAWPMPCATFSTYLSGAVLEFGLGEQFKALFDEVQRSNMSKACKSEEEAAQTVQHYLQKDGTKCYYKKEGNQWLVYRESDNKTIKSIGYSPANLERILHG